MHNQDMPNPNSNKFCFKVYCSVCGYKLEIDDVKIDYSVEKVGFYNFFSIKIKPCPCCAKEKKYIDLLTDIHDVVEKFRSH